MQICVKEIQKVRSDISRYRKSLNLAVSTQAEVKTEVITKVAHLFTFLYRNYSEGSLQHRQHNDSKPPTRHLLTSQLVFVFVNHLPKDGRLS